MRHHAHHNTKTDVVIPVVGIVPITIGATHVPIIIVERTATQHAHNVFSQPRQFALAQELYVTASVLCEAVFSPSRNRGLLRLLGFDTDFALLNQQRLAMT